MAVLEVTNLTKDYQMGEVVVQALRGVDFAVEEGQFVAVMGPSGSGKSTLLHILGGLDVPSGGEVRLGGQNISALSDAELTVLRRRRIGFIFQFFNLLPTLTAGENVALPLLIDGQDGAQHQARIMRLLDLVGLRNRQHHKPDQLSGGEQQRVAIARAFVNAPDIVLADEPTGNLDTRSGAAVLELIRRSCDELGATIVMVTHDPGAASYADRVIFLRDGQIVDELGGEQAHDRVAIARVMAGLE